MGRGPGTISPAFLTWRCTMTNLDFKEIKFCGWGKDQWSLAHLIYTSSGMGEPGVTTKDALEVKKWIRESGDFFYPGDFFEQKNAELDHAWINAVCNNAKALIVE
jgi:hypothetical protein